MHSLEQTADILFSHWLSLNGKAVYQRLEFLNGGKYELPTVTPFHLNDVAKAVNAAFYMVLQIPCAPLYNAFPLIVNLEERNEEFPLTVHVKGASRRSAIYEI